MSITNVRLSIGGLTVLHPASVLEWGEHNRAPTEYFELANSYSCPIGKAPGVAWLLMLRGELDQLAKNEFQELKWSDGYRLLTVPELSIVKSYNVNRSLPGDPRAARLVQLVDKRRQLAMSSLNAQYNVRIPAPSTTSGDGLYYTASLNGGSAWTWQTLVSNIWAALPTTAGTAPTLPYTPDGTPEGWRFIGENAWDALHVVLEKIGCTTAYNPVLNEFSYVRLGTTQSGLSEKLTSNDYRSRLLFDYDPDDDYHLGNVPETVRVFFARRELYHGVERDTPNASNWEMTPAVSKDYATAADGAISGSVLVVWDDLPALYDTANSNSNSAALQTRADEIGANIANRLQVSEERFNRWYSGVVVDEELFPGSEVSEITWRDYGDDEGLLTEIILAPPEQPESLGRSLVAEHVTTLDLDRPSYPLWPHVAQLVQADNGVASTGATLTANADNLFPGFVHRYANGTYGQLEAIWIRPADLETGGSPSETDVISVRQKDRFLGRLFGIQTSGGSTRPVYVARVGTSSTSNDVNILWGIATSNWEDNSPSCHTVDVNPVDDCEGTNPDTGTTHTVTFPPDAYGDPNIINGQVLAYHQTVDGGYAAIGGIDARIGSVKMWALASGDIPQGWASMDGTANSIGNGGSGIVMNTGATDGGGWFVRGSDTAGTQGGEYEHTHTLNVNVDAVVFNAAITAGLIIDDHTVADLSHNHGLTEGTPGTSDCWDSSLGEVNCPPLDCTGGPKALDTGLLPIDQQDCASAEDWGPLSHSFSLSVQSGDSYTEAFVDSTIEPSTHYPEYKTLIFIERIDNSV